jgi:2'-5' RNA ligase
LAIADGLRDHWQWRPEWASDRPCLLWYLTFPHQTALWRLAERVQSRVGGVRTVDVVPLSWLHLTLDDVGFVDELTPGQVEDVVESVHGAVEGWRVPPITLGPVTTMVGALVLRAAPEAELGQLRDLLRASARAVLGPDAPSVLGDFWPHVTLAYSNAACDRHTVMEPLGTVSFEQVVVAAPSLTLAAATRRNRHYQWTARSVIALT